MAIRRLPTLLVNQIAAGEVIERPASVVKECLENAVDAGATRIQVQIEQGGKELIRIADDGCGISAAELPLAIAPHATSKINSAEDLNAIGTLGFRGEALASIASVSRLSMTSRPANEPSAATIECEGGTASAVRPAGSPPGTSITVRNLFFNTPARRKFLKTDETEAGRIRDVVENLAISHPALAISLAIDDRTVVDVPAPQEPRERVLAVLGDELAGELLDLAWTASGVRVWGLAGKPSIARGTGKHQRVFLNGRPINDRTVLHAVKEAYRGLIEPARWPTIVLLLEMDPASVDVNVHPTKAEVRFRNSTVVHSAVLSAVRQALRAADLTPALELKPPAWTWPSRDALGPGGGTNGPADSATPNAPDAHAFVDYFKRLNPVQKSFVYSEVKQALAETSPAMLEALSAEGAAGANRAAGMNLEASHGDTLTTMIRAVQGALQVHSSYIVTQDDQGIVIIDQHALHERVMFEQLKARIGSGTLESQRLLMPAVVPVDATQMEALAEVQGLLQRIGIEAEPIGPQSVAIHAFSSLLFERGVEPAEFMSDLLSRAARGEIDPKNTEGALHEVLDMMACKAAVKAGDSLTPTELEALLQQRELIERSSNCPHGRPTSLRLSLADLERQFGRR